VSSYGSAGHHDEESLRRMVSEYTAGMPEPLQDLIRRAVLEPRADGVPLLGRQLPLEAGQELLEQLLELYHAEPKMRLRAQDRPGAALIPAAWWCVAYRQAAAANVLMGAGYAVEAAPNVRSALEHAIMLQALGALDREGKLDAYLDDMHRQNGMHAERRLDELVRLFEDLPVEMLADVDLVKQISQHAPLPDADPYWKREDRNVWAMSQRFDAGPAAYAEYRELSARAHAGLGSAQPFLEHAVRGSGLRREPFACSPGDDIAMLVTAIAMANEGIDHFLDPPVMDPLQQPVLARCLPAPDALLSPRADG
jgi:hypothetical protein